MMGGPLAALGGAGMGGGVGPGEFPAPPPPPPPAPVAPVSGVGGNLFDRLMQAASDPNAAAIGLARDGISPDMLKQQMERAQGNQLAKAMQPPAVRGSERSEAPVGKKVLGDLMQPLPKTQQSGQLWEQFKNLFAPESSQMATQGGKNTSQLFGGNALNRGVGIAEQLAPSKGQLPIAPPIAPQAGQVPVSMDAIPPTGGIPPLSQQSAYPQAMASQRASGAEGTGERAVALITDNQRVVPLPSDAESSGSLPIISERIADTAPRSVVPGIPNEASIRSKIPVGAEPSGLEQNIPSSILGAAPQVPESFKGRTLYSEFMNTVKSGGVTNPNALAAIAATGQRESGFNANNVFGAWDDVGQTAGGTMSWRAERFQAMKAFAAKNGGDAARPSPELQAKFLLQENPDLIAKLNAAKTPEEAIKLMNDAWKFEGYDNPSSSEYQARVNLTKNLAADFAKGGDGSTKISSTPSTETGPTTGTTTGTTAPAGSPEDKRRKMFAALSEGLKDYDESKKYHVPPPDAIAPRPGQYEPDANMMKLMMMMLAGGGGGAIPTIGQIMSGAVGKG